jgi:hypothetical protein
MYPTQHNNKKIKNKTNFKSKLKIKRIPPGGTCFAVYKWSIPTRLKTNRGKACTFLTLKFLTEI